ncbi:MAG: sulfurtransferase TusA family protein [Magnetococcales bacterium]|nr:sulfurtransferase TusA family protein [Magnetococcales bacterium]MBF0156331.1 sulfurtransferase TusA family protein [Magnetococcales bacterium]
MVSLGETSPDEPSPPPRPHRQVDARNLLCPMPILRAEAAIAEMAPGEILALLATDPGLERDLPAWCRVNHHTLITIRRQGRELTGWVRKEKIGP